MPDPVPDAFERWWNRYAATYHPRAMCRLLAVNAWQQSRQEAWEEAIEVVRTLRFPDSATYRDEDGAIVDALRQREAGKG
jgi:hypothetical protein